MTTPSHHAVPPLAGSLELPEPLELLLGRRRYESGHLVGHSQSAASRLDHPLHNLSVPGFSTLASLTSLGEEDVEPPELPPSLPAVPHPLKTRCAPRGPSLPAVPHPLKTRCAPLQCHPPSRPGAPPAECPRVALSGGGGMALPGGISQP